MAPRLSMCAIALDEQDLIGPMLDSVDVSAGELIIGVDTRTTDNTSAIAKHHGARIVDVDWRDDFSYARNLTLEAATGDWILVLDADERLTPGGAAAVREVLQVAPGEPGPDAVTGLMFLIGQFDLAGALHGVHRSSGRLFRRRPEIRYRGIIHEEPIWLPDPARTSWGLVDGVLAIAHVGYDPSLWVTRGKRDRNLRLLERRVAGDPQDVYARDKLAQQQGTEGPWSDGAPVALHTTAVMMRAQGSVPGHVKPDEPLEG